LIFLRRSIEEAAFSSESFYSVFRMFLQVLHDSDLLSEEMLVLWIDARRTEEPQSKAGKLFSEPLVQAFVEWLEDDEDDDEDDDESDNEDDEN